MNTKHFKINTGYTEIQNFYRLLLAMAAGWEQRQIVKVRLFKAGFVDVYLSITATCWYHPSDANDPDWQGDAMDYITDSKEFRYHYRSLQSKPYPERRWRGHWREFNGAAELETYALEMLVKLSTWPAQGVLPCPICQELPPISEWAGGFIVRCSGDRIHHPQIGAGCWATHEEAVDNWNRNVTALQPLLDGEVFPCPICGKPPRIEQEYPTWWKIECYSGHACEFLFGSVQDQTREAAVAEWNTAIQAIAKSKAKGEK